MAKDDASIINIEDTINSASISKYHIFVAFICASVLLIDGYNAAVLNYLAPYIIENMHLNHSEFGPVLSASQAGNLVGFFLTPFLTARIGPKHTTIVSVALFGLFETLSAFSPNIWSLAVLRFIGGIGLSGAFITSIAIVGELYPIRWRSSAITYVFMGNTLGQLCAGAATNSLSGHFGWRVVIGVGGVGSLLMLIPLIKALPDSPDFMVYRRSWSDRATALLTRLSPASMSGKSIFAVKPESARKPSVTQLFESDLSLVTVCYWVAYVLLTIVVSSIIYSWMATLLVVAGFSKEVSVTATMFITASGLVAGVTVGPLMDRIGAFGAVMSLMILAGLSWAVVGVLLPIGNLTLTVATLFVAGFCTSGAAKGIAALAIFIYSPALRATALGWGMGIGRFGAVLGPLVVGYMLDAQWGSSRVFLAASLPMILGGVALMLGYRSQRR